jgi:type VI secretion system protein VasG
MAKLNLKSLIGKLNSTCREALESAAGLCLSHTHYEVDLEHFLIKLLEKQDTDLQRIFRYFEVNEAHLVGDLTRSIEEFKSGNARTPALSPQISKMVREAWLVASVDFYAAGIRSGHIILALLSDSEMGRTLCTSSSLLKKISISTLAENLVELCSGSAEDSGGETQSRPSATTGSGGQAVGKQQNALAQYTINLTDKAKKGEIDPVLGRDFEIRQMVDILIRRRQNNPILTGEAGVGKTAVVEGFALRIAEGDVPPPLQGVAIHTLDLGLLQAGAGMKGEFEERLKSVIEEVKSSPVPIILFIDEAHTLVGAGGAAGSGDAANLLKPALARGELRTIAATTWSEYKKYFEKDAALTRRFQVVKIDEPDETKAVMMMRAVAPFLENHHGVLMTDEALIDSVRLSHRYLPARQLPDKSVSVLDTACARIAIGLNTIPAPIEAATRHLSAMEREVKILEREVLMGKEHAERLQELADDKAATEADLEVLQLKWKQEMEVVDKIQGARKKIQELAAAEDVDVAAVDEEKANLKELEVELLKVQDGDPLVQVEVDSEIISDVISGWTGIPTGRMIVDEIATVLNLDKILAERLVGQDHALKEIAQVMQNAHAGIEDPNKPTGVFLFAGPSGVGKTETALAISDLLYGGEDNVISINMSEYQEAHTVSSLKGSPPGYVGYGEGGVLTEAVRKRPYSVVLLDEVEKAHPDVMELFFQVFDKGVLEDGEGRRIDFKNTLIILTSNLGTDAIVNVCADEETMPDAQGLSNILRPELLKHFKPAFLGRLKIVPYFPLAPEVLRSIVRLKLNKIAKRMMENRKVSFSYDDDLVDSIAARCTEVDSGARNVDHILSDTLMPQMSRELLSRMATSENLEEVKVSIDGDGFVFAVH